MSQACSIQVSKTTVLNASDLLFAVNATVECGRPALIDTTVCLPLRAWSCGDLR